jgi:hypothetical protein
LGKKLKHGEPSDVTFFGGQKVEPFFSPFWIPYLFMNSKGRKTELERDVVKQELDRN